ncbi:MAG: hypothetical protein FWC87_04670 [Acidimicrobiaceae bacterium]|nr:hypothetical protein [Acidimicrobiaceae bacterium]
MSKVKPAGKLVGTTWKGRLVRLSSVAAATGLGVSALASVAQVGSSHVASAGIAGIAAAFL